LRNIIITLFALVFSATLLSQPFYHYDKIGNAEVSQELSGIYLSVRNALKDRGVNVDRLDVELDGVYLVDDLSNLTGRPNTLGVTLINGKNTNKKDLILIDRSIDSYFKLVITMYHEVTHYITQEGDCNQGLFLFQPNYYEQYNNEATKIVFSLYVDELAKFIKTYVKKD